MDKVKQILDSIIDWNYDKYCKTRIGMGAKPKSIDEFLSSLRHTRLSITKGQQYTLRKTFEYKYEYRGYSFYWTPTYRHFSGYGGTQGKKQVGYALHILKL